MYLLSLDRDILILFYILGIEQIMCPNRRIDSPEEALHKSETVSWRDYIFLSEFNILCIFLVLLCYYTQSNIFIEINLKMSLMLNRSGIIREVLDVEKDGIWRNSYI